MITFILHGQGMVPVVWMSIQDSLFVCLHFIVSYLHGYSIHSDNYLTTIISLHLCLNRLNERFYGHNQFAHSISVGQETHGLARPDQTRQPEEETHSFMRVTKTAFISKMIRWYFKRNLGYFSASKLTVIMLCWIISEKLFSSRDWPTSNF